MHVDNHFRKCSLSSSSRVVRIAGLVVVCLALASCSLLPSFGSKADRRVQVYTLNPELSVTSVNSGACSSLVLGDAISAPGFRSSRMAYSTAPYEIDYFAYARWADTVARLVRRPLQRGFEAHGGFTQVMTAPALAPARFRVELTDVSLLQRFDSRKSAQSVVELAANVRVFAVNPNSVLASKVVQLQAPAGGDPASGVAVANGLVDMLINEVVSLAYAACTEAS